MDSDRSDALTLADCRPSKHVLVDPADALARRQLARALVLAADAGTARSVYDELLALWTDADVDAPVVRAAKGERTQLH